MTLERIDARDRLEALRPAWSALWDRCPNATPFQSPEWLLPWWDVFAPGGIETLALHDGDRLAGLAPLYRAEDGIARFIGAGISDYLDVLAEPGFESDVAAAVFSLRNADLTDLPASSPLLASPPVAAEPCAVCPVLALPAQPGYNLRRNLRRYGTRLARAHRSAASVGQVAGPPFIATGRRPVATDSPLAAGFPCGDSVWKGR